MHNYSAVMEYNGDCAVTFQTGSGIWIERRVTFCVKMEEMERAEENRTKMDGENSPATSKRMRLIEGLELILNNFYWTAIPEILKDQLFGCMQKIGTWILQKTIRLCMKQDIQLHLKGKIKCKDLRKAAERDSSIQRDRNRFHQQEFTDEHPQEDKLQVAEGGRWIPRDTRKYEFTEEPEEELANATEVAEPRMKLRDRGRYEDSRRRPEIQVAEELRLVPLVLSQEFTQEPEANPLDAMQVVHINSTNSMSSIDTNLQKKDTNTTAVDWYFRRHRSRRRRT